MGPNIIERAVASYEGIRASGRRHPFDKGVQGFMRILTDLPGTERDKFSDEDFRLLTTVAEGVIESIEQRVDSQRESGTDNLLLVKAVYEIRRDLEVIDRWHRQDLKI
jgi:hypothetical protein